MSRRSGVLKGHITSKVQSLRNPLNLQSNSKARHYAGLLVNGLYTPEYIQRRMGDHPPGRQQSAQANKEHAQERSR